MLLNSIAALVALCSASVSAHISLAQPVPYGKPDTSPLSPSGSNYPCKTENGFKVNSVTKMAVGESQKLAFSGTAVHGGGSCQLSLTSGFTPTGSSQFKVIYSIEGGCPGTDGSTVGYDFKIPAEVPAGDYTLAWTWFNRIGNREMYMNCAPITVTGGSGSQSSFSALPDMAIFNIQSKNSCGTTEGTDVAFPNPGQYVLKGAGNKPGAPTNCGAAAAPAAGSAGNSGKPATGTSGSGSGSGTGSANNGQYTGVGASSSKPSVAAAAPQVAAPASSPSGATSPASGGRAGTFAEGSNGASSAAAASPAAATPAVQSVAPAAAATPAVQSVAPVAAATPSPAAAKPATASDGGSCSTDGAVVCSADGAKFGLCNWGKVVMMDVAAGTKCVGGQILRKRSFLA